MQAVGDGFLIWPGINVIIPEKNLGIILVIYFRIQILLFASKVK
jgi:hypothetical protein